MHSSWGGGQKLGGGGVGSLLFFQYWIVLFLLSPKTDYEAKNIQVLLKLAATKRKNGERKRKLHNSEKPILPQ